MDAKTHRAQGKSGAQPTVPRFKESHEAMTSIKQRRGPISFAAFCKLSTFHLFTARARLLQTSNGISLLALTTGHTRPPSFKDGVLVCWRSLVVLLAPDKVPEG